MKKTSAIILAGLYLACGLASLEAQTKHSASSRYPSYQGRVMYDLSGLRNQGEDCSVIIQDWKELVDELKVTTQPTNNYLYHRDKPLVVIWGLGFPDRGYSIRNIGIDKVIRFLKNDPQYGGCSVIRA